VYVTMSGYLISALVTVEIRATNKDESTTLGRILVMIRGISRDEAKQESQKLTYNDKEVEAYQAPVRDLSSH